MRLFLIYSCIAIPVWVAQFALYFYTGPALQFGNIKHLQNHLEDQCTLLWTAEDGVVYNP